MSRATDAATEAQVAVVAAAGNSGPAPETIVAPGDARKVITVGSIGDDHDLSDFSSRGPVGNFWDSYLKPEVVAPGEDVIAPDANTGNGYTSKSGTSMATPHVSGAAALLDAQSGGGLNAAQLKAKLQQTADDLGKPGADPAFGKGRINVCSLVNC